MPPADQSPPQVVILSASRTAIGRFGGAFKDVHAAELGAVAARAAIAGAGVSEGDIQEVLVGHGRPAGVGPNPARQVGHRAGVPHAAPAYTINKACAGGMQAVASGAQSILLGQSKVVLDGIITAGSASGITDGAAALVLSSPAFAEARGLKPLARIVGWASAGVDPRIMGIGPVPAIAKLQQRTGLGINDFDLVEINEAFAAQVLAVLKDVPIPVEKLNVNGGARIIVTFAA